YCACRTGSKAKRENVDIAIKKTTRSARAEPNATVSGLIGTERRTYSVYLLSVEEAGGLAGAAGARGSICALIWRLLSPCGSATESKVIDSFTGGLPPG